MSQDEALTIRRGSQNLFADLGYAEADTHLLKAELVMRLSAVMEQRQLTQSEVARRTGVSQPDISRILKGRFRDVSVDRIMRMLARLGCEIDIFVKTAGEPSPSAPIHYRPSPV